MSLLAASVLVGIFLAVFGQIYQTGADAYQLFVTWAYLIVIWTLINPFIPQLILQIVLLNTALLLFVMQTEPFDTDKVPLPLLFTGLNGVFLVIREWFEMKRVDWITRVWFRLLLAFATLIPMFFSLVIYIFDTSPAQSILISAGFGLWLHVILFGIYRYWIKDILTLALNLLSVTTLLVLYLFNLFTDRFDLNPTGVFLLMGLVTIALFGGLIVYLRVTQQRFAHQC